MNIIKKLKELTDEYEGLYENANKLKESKCINEDEFNKNN